MSGAEVIGLVSGIIAIIDVIVKIQDAAQQASGLPAAFRDVARRMPLLRDTMLAVQEDLSSGGDDRSFEALGQVLDSCKEKVDSLEKIFREVIVTPDASRTQRYTSAVRTLGKGRTLEDHMSGITADIHLLMANYAIKAATRTKLGGIVGEMEISQSHQGSNLESYIANHGTGSQNIHTGTGDQNINSGSGGQFSGHFEGPFNFSSSVNR
ncbi:hypothetical protein EsH8_VII_000425 [Colletotrichum jinshuiense]